MAAVGSSDLAVNDIIQRAHLRRCALIAGAITGTSGTPSQAKGVERFSLRVTESIGCVRGRQTPPL